MKISHLPIALSCLALSFAPAFADGFRREELRIPMAAAGAQGLEALLVRPGEPGRYPLVLINHGSPRSAQDRPGMTPLAMLPQAMEFARRGWAVLAVMRRGYGASGGGWAEDYGPCSNPDYLAAARASVADLNAVIAYARTRQDIDASKIVSVGQSAGGFATVAFSAEQPSGLAAIINFAGGRGARRADEVCGDTKLIEAFRTFGASARVPQLWIYTENDHFFGPALAQKFNEAFANKAVEFIKAESFGEDGHLLFTRPAGTPIWTAYVDDFLKRHRLAPRATLIALPAPAVTAPAQLSERGRKAFEEFLASAPHKAFAVSADGHFGWRSRQRNAEDARRDALEFCTKSGATCRVIAVDDKPE
jgi:dienelactone hydrolase